MYLSERPCKIDDQLTVLWAHLPQIGQKLRKASILFGARDPGKRQGDAAYEEWREVYRTFLVALKTRHDDDEAPPPSTASRFDHDAARERLHAISDDPAVLDGFERLVQSGDFDDAFLQATYDANISLLYLAVKWRRL